jgi:hypothetical protein
MKRITGGAPIKMADSAQPKEKRNTGKACRKLAPLQKRKRRTPKNLADSPLPKKKRITGGAARNLAHVHHQICDRSLIKVCCLKIIFTLEIRIF